MVNLPALVHRPQSQSMKDLVHLLLPRVRFTCTTWSWSELGGAARDMVDVVVVGARWSCSGRGRRGENPLLFSDGAPAGGEVTGELPRRR